MLIASVRMSGAPDCSCRNAYFFIKLDDTKSISSSSFDHTDVDPEAICSTMSATDVDIIVAALKMALNCRQAFGFTFRNAAFLFEAFSGDEANTFCVVKDVSIAEFDFLSP